MTVAQDVSAIPVAERMLRLAHSSFFDRDAVDVARDLIGAEFLVAGVGGIIVETEAYTLDDPASHSFRGETRRNAPMFAGPGTAYVYLSYGVHWCTNVACRPGCAVLLRALEPTSGCPAMSERRGVAEARLLASGPGRLSQALGIDDALNGRSILELPFSLRRGEPAEVVTGPRIGISRAQERPWRFGRAGSRFLSKPFAIPSR